jgi:hypothetical protein
MIRRDDSTRHGLLGLLKEALDRSVPTGALPVPRPRDALLFAAELAPVGTA